MNYTEKILNHANKINELHNIASEAVRKGVLSSFTVNDRDHSDIIGKGLYLGLNMTYHAIELEINNIKSMMENGDKKEPSATFDDLIDVAVQAYKDGVLSDMELDESGLSSSQVMCCISAYKENIEKAINDIQALYKETFTIESEDDVNRINLEIAEAELENGKSIPLDIFKGKMDNYYIFCLLKGATITQKKGGK